MNNSILEIQFLRQYKPHFFQPIKLKNNYRASKMRTDNSMMMKIFIVSQFCIFASSSIISSSKIERCIKTDETNQMDCKKKITLSLSVDQSEVLFLFLLFTTKNSYREKKSSSRIVKLMEFQLNFKNLKLD